ncbi:MAG TPA: hypothetical protein VGF30_06155 [Bacteroidia bacterium]
MKKILFLAFPLIFISCKKNYICECVTTYPGSNSTSTTTIHDTEKKAKNSCSEKNTTATAFGYTSTTTCTIK